MADTPQHRSKQIKPIIGLVGGIGSGKTRVASMLAQWGARVISGDKIGHEVLRQPTIHRLVLDRWGPQVLEEGGQIDRHRLGAIVFADSTQRRALENLVHPWIERRIREQIAEAENDPSVRLIVLDAAVMLEAGWNKLCDFLVYVDVPQEVRLQRLAEERRWTPKEVQAREDAQMDVTEKARLADGTVDNSGSLEETARQVHHLLDQWGIALEGAHDHERQRGPAKGPLQEGT